MPNIYANDAERVLTYVAGYLKATSGSVNDYTTEELMEKVKLLVNFIETNIPELNPATRAQ